MRVCVVSFKECWRDGQGRWLATGGFPVQMTGIASLFDEMTLVMERGRPGNGGLSLPEGARVVQLLPPPGEDRTLRKLSVLALLPHYLITIGRHIRQADVVHIPLPGDLPLLGMLLALALRKRLIVRYGGSWASTSQTTFMNRVTRACMRKFAGGRNVMLATGAGDVPPAERMGWIFATALSRAELGTIRPALERGLSDPPRVVYVGRLSVEKGLACLIEAVAILKREGFRPLPRVTLIGDGPDRKVLEERVKKLNFRETIVFAGQLDRRELSAYLSQADLCVQPSLTEGFSKAWLDAMAYALPVLASEVGAARVVIGSQGERGWLVPAGDAPALAAAFRRVLGDDVDWSALRRRCRAYVEARTVEAWSAEIGKICTTQWRISSLKGNSRKS